MSLVVPCRDVFVIVLSSDIKKENVYVFPYDGNSLDRFKSHHVYEPIIPLYLMTKELVRLEEYSNRSNTPYLFSQQVAFNTAFSTSVSYQSAKRASDRIAKHYEEEFKQIDALLKGDRKTILRCIAPNVSNE